MSHLRFVIPGEPVGKGRARASRTTKSVILHTPEKTQNYENHCRRFAKDAMKGRIVMTGAVGLTLDLYVQPPLSWSKKKIELALSGELKPTSKPDFSNVLKAIEDAMNGIVYADDSQIVMVTGSKNYSSNPGAFVEIIPL